MYNTHYLGCAPFDSSRYLKSVATYDFEAINIDSTTVAQSQQSKHRCGFIYANKIVKMQRILAGVFFLAIFFHQSQAQCTPANCVEPACKCMNTSPPGGLSRADTPQLVFLAFDGAITTTNYDNYTYLFNNTANPNGCPIGMTFFIFHEYNDYTLTHSLYFKEQEIATHSMSHLTPASTWANKSVAEWTDEIGGIQEALAKFANIPKTGIRGARAPFLQSSGDATFTAMKNLGIFYDCSFPTTENTDPPVWPYTLDQGFQHECAIPPCPKSNYPGIWTVPMVALNRNGTVCSMADACEKPNTLDETYQYLMDNFQRHYNTSKAPFGIYLTANGWFQEADYRLLGYKKFLNTIAVNDDVYIVPIARGLDWMKNPKPLAEAGNFFDCPVKTKTVCSDFSCYYEGDASPVGPRNMESCVTCPDVYPWTGNPLGLP